MVNPKKVEKKLAGLLINGKTTDSSEWNEYQKKRQRLATYKKHHPDEYQGFTNQFANLLEKIDDALYSDMVTIDKNLTDSVREAFRKKKH